MRETERGVSHTGDEYQVCLSMSVERIVILHWERTVYSVEEIEQTSKVPETNLVGWGACERRYVYLVRKNKWVKYSDSWISSRNY